MTRKPYHWAPLLVRLSPLERQAIDRFRDVEGWTLAGLVRHALREYLRCHGYWPPAPSGRKEKAPPSA